MPPAGSDVPKSPASTRRPANVLIFTLIAVAAALARAADGRLLIPDGGVFALQLPALVSWCHLVWTSRRKPGNTADGVLTLVAVGLGASLAINAGRLDSFFVTTTCYIAGSLFVDELTRVFSRLADSIDRPRDVLRAILPPWLVLIVLATILLSVPVATKSGVPDYRHNFWLHIGNSAVNAVSVACLVGTSTYSLGEEYSLFGKWVIVVLTQVVGLFFAAIGLAIIRPFLHSTIPLQKVVKLAIALQIIGILVMSTAWHDADAPSPLARTWWGLIHSQSALFNSGWMLPSDGLAQYFKTPAIYTTVLLLAITGAIGLPVLLDLLRRRPHTASHQFRPLPPWKQLPQWEAATALALVVGVAVSIWLFETPRFLPDNLVPQRPFDFEGSRVCLRDDIGHRDRWTMSVFIASTLRSAGLQSVPVSEGAMSWPSYVVMIGAMLLGGSAGGMAGGLRTTAILLPLIVIFTGRLRWASQPGGMEARRCLLVGGLQIAAATILLNLAAVLALAATIDATWYDRTFEAVAATNSVGLSTGLTLHLTAAGRVAMMLFMIAGRLVPIILWLRLTARLHELAPSATEPESSES